MRYGCRNGSGRRVARDRLTFGLAESADYRAVNIERDGVQGTRFRYTGPWDNFQSPCVWQGISTSVTRSRL